jgi:hypothetical protein
MFEEYFLVIEESTSISAEYWRFFFCLLFSIVIGVPYTLLPPIATLKHVVNISLGIMYISFVWNDYTSWLHGFIDSTICYLIAYIGGKKHAAASGKIIFAFAMFYMSAL